jgi:hypothetical protein
MIRNANRRHQRPGRHLSGWPSRMPDAAEKHSGRFGGSVRAEAEEG